MINADKVSMEHETLTLDQCKALVNYIAKAIETKGESAGTFRHLIYDVLKIESYNLGMELGLLNLNNLLCFNEGFSNGK